MNTKFETRDLYHVGLMNQVDILQVRFLRSFILRLIDKIFTVNQSKISQENKVKNLYIQYYNDV